MKSKVPWRVYVIEAGKHLAQETLLYPTEPEMLPREHVLHSLATKGF